ncbi:MAG: radical SAM protein [Solirubrobacteraceae bacterium]|nr:radical SAM protein [Solirubrobacteraceae bacterium]
MRDLSSGPVLQVHPSRRCNLSCGHCYSSSGPREDETLPQRLLVDAIREAAWFGYEQLAVSGGEPMLSEDLPVLLRRARTLEMTTSVTTNGLLLGQTRRWQRIAPLIDVLAISIDGTEEEHDRLRGRQGAYAHVVRNLEAVRATGTPFGFITTLTQYNAASIESVVRLAAEQGARSVQVHPLSGAGRAAIELPGEQPDAIELAAALLEARRLGEQYGVPVHVDALTADQLVLYRGDLVPPFPARSVTQLAPVLIVESSGRVRPLAHELPDELAIGNLHRAPLHRLVAEWERSDRAARLAAACEETWTDLVGADADPAAAWADEVARRAAARVAAERQAVLPIAA